MKIVYYLPSLEAPGGLERVVTFKANYFAEHVAGYDVTIVTSEQRGAKPHFPLSSKVKHLDINVPFDVDRTSTKGADGVMQMMGAGRLISVLKYPFRYLRFKKRLTRLLNELRPDITLSTLRRELNFLSSLKDGSAKVGEFHVTRHSYGVGSSDNRFPGGTLLRKRWEKRFVRNLSQLEKLVILTHEEALNWPELDNKVVIANPIVMPIERPSDCQTRQVIAVGRYVPQKGFDLLIESWAIVSARYPSWVLRIYGEGALRGELQRQIERLGLSQTCILEPTVSNIADKYGESSIFVLSSRFEGFGMVITEAMACGVPPVSFACPCGPRDIICHGKDGLLAKPEDIADLAAKIGHLIEYEDVRKKMGEQARKSAERFRMEQIAQQWEALFESLIKKEQIDNRP